MKAMNNMRALAVALLAATLPMVAAAQQPTIKTPPEGKAYAIKSTNAAVGSGTVTYQWYRNDVPITNATAASYTVPANEAYGVNVEFKRRAECNGADEAWSNAVLVSFLPDLSAKITGSTNVCPGASGLTYSVINVQGTSYAWTVPAGWTITAGQGKNSITVTAAGSAGSGTISVTPTSAGGSKGAARTLAVSISAADQPSAISGSAAVCDGASGLIYSVANVQGATYNWAVPSGWNITAGQGTSSITVAAGAVGGTVSVTSYRCNSSSTAALGVAVGGTPAQPSAITGVASACSGQAFTYSVANTGITYTWAVPAGWNITAGQGTNSITVTAGASGGTISVTPSTTCGGNGTPRQLAVAVAPVPAQPLAITASASAICAGQTGITYSVDNASGIAYAWTVPNGWTITAVQGTNSITVTAGSSNGLVSVTPSVCGSSGASRSVAVTVGSAPAQPSTIAANVGVICSGQSGVVYSVTNVVGVSYAWTVPAGWTITAGQGSSSVTVTAGSAGGNISVTPSSCGGSGKARTLAVTVSTSPAQPSIITPSPAAVCAGQTGITYSVTNVAGVAYAWEAPNGWTITAGQGTSSITVTAGSANGSVSVTPSACGSSGTARTLTVAVGNSPSQPSDIVGEMAVCYGQAVSYTVTSVAGITYTWTVPDGWQITAGQSTSSITVTADTLSGLIIVTPSTACGGSGSTRALWVTANAEPPQPVIYSIDQFDNIFTPSAAVCSGQTISYVAYSPDAVGVFYSWTVPAGWKIISGGQGSSSITVKTDTASGVISVTPYACGSIAGAPDVLAVTAQSCAAAPCNNGKNTAIGATCWASANVGAINTFAAKPDMYTEFYQWNRLVAYSANEPLSPAWNAAAEQSAVWTNNPCPVGWRLPTQAQLLALLNSSSPANGSWAAAGERGNAVAGRFFGPNNAGCKLPDSMFGCVFLPAAGSRSYSNGTLYNQGNNGSYWSGTNSSSTNGYNLNFGNDYTYPTGESGKAYGYSIRCVQH